MSFWWVCERSLFPDKSLQISVLTVSVVLCLTERSGSGSPLFAALHVFLSINNTLFIHGLQDTHTVDFLVQGCPLTPRNALNAALYLSIDVLDIVSAVALVLRNPHQVFESALCCKTFADLAGLGAFCAVFMQQLLNCHQHETVFKQWKARLSRRVKWLGSCCIDTLRGYFWTTNVHFRACHCLRCRLLSTIVFGLLTWDWPVCDLGNDVGNEVIECFTSQLAESTLSTDDKVEHLEECDADFVRDVLVNKHWRLQPHFQRAEHFGIDFFEVHECLRLQVLIVSIGGCVRIEVIKQLLNAQKQSRQQKQCSVAHVVELFAALRDLFNRLHFFVYCSRKLGYLFWIL